MTKLAEDISEIIPEGELGKSETYTSKLKSFHMEKPTRRTVELVKLAVRS